TGGFAPPPRAVRAVVDNVARAACGGSAAATALTMIPEVDKDKTIAVGIGGGTYRGYQAVALGATARITENIKVRAGVGMSSGGTTAGIGASMQW
ncbi:YadA C-terminal domain-containing protein, partial [Burkholderia pseudomallei]|uniref:YadA C-terminal domain-containing protein n=1 Tax=Burkholderia pseudomallei TaxID=28450 RepID=UPI0011775CAE